MSGRTLWLILGVGYMVLGVLTLVFYRKAARQGARFHQRMARFLPSLYQIPPANFATSEKAWRPLAIFIGLLVAGLGVVITFDLFDTWD